MSKKPKFKFISDAAHAWLRVPIPLIRNLNIEDQISQMSYISAQWVYLEEDKDLPLFLKAIGGKDKIEMEDHYVDGMSTIRNFTRYRPVLANLNEPTIIRDED